MKRPDFAHHRRFCRHTIRDAPRYRGALHILGKKSAE
jgi:hypothetical protein